MLLLLLVTQRTHADPPNCRPINASVGEDDSIRVFVHEILSNQSTSYPVTLTVTNEFQGVIWRGIGLERNDYVKLPACRYLRSQLGVTVSNVEGECSTFLTIKSSEQFVMRSNLDTTLWCVDPLLQLDETDIGHIDWYNDESWPYTLLPTISIFCDEDKVFPREPRSVSEVRNWYLERYEECQLRATDWDRAFPCYQDQDTSKIIYREWEAFDKEGDRHVVWDTIVAIKLPEITSENIYAPDRDTVRCFLDTIYTDRFSYDYIYWKQLVGLHSEGTLLYYSKYFVDLAISSATSDSARSFLEANKILIREDDDIAYDVYDIAALPTAIGPSGELSYVIEVEEDDEVLSLEGTYITVERDWFFRDGESAIYVDLAIPSIDVKSSYVVVDKWLEEDCEHGIKMIVPTVPYQEESCRILCINQENIGSSQCYITLEVEDGDTTLFCPRLIEREFVLKQYCYSKKAVSDSLMCSISPDDSGVDSIRVDNHDASVTITATQWKVYIDRIGPIVRGTKGRRIWSPADNRCDAQVVVPSIKAEDYCSGVRSVKATIGNLGFVQLELGDDGYWHQPDLSRKYSLTCGGPYQVTYELVDNCYNIRRVSPTEIVVRDNEPPTVALNTSNRISLGSKSVWVDASKFDAGSFDNCAIRMVLGRRTDWKTSCGVNLCDEVVGSIQTREELDEYIQQYGYTSTLMDNDIERKYANEGYKWIKEDGQWCDSVENYLIKGWEDDIVRHWVENCLDLDYHNHEFEEQTSFYASIGGGWSNEIPFCCDDVCQTVTVELLVIDKSCNFSKGWMSVIVENKTAIGRLSSFDDIYLSCDSYKSFYQQQIEQAIGGNSENNSEIYAQIDESLGRLVKAWEDVDGTLVDEQGVPIEEEHSYKTTHCRYDIQTIRKKVIDHDGDVVWQTTYDTAIVLVDTVLKADQGLLAVQCNARCVQDIWENLNDCGIGTITRRWKVYNDCSNHDDPIEYTQVIHIDNPCPLSPHMFDLPSDTTLCQELKYDASGDVAVDVGTMTYRLGDLSCRSLDLGYQDQVSQIIGKRRTYKVKRTWTVSDWCSTEQINYEQTFALYDTCSGGSSSHLISGRVQMHHDEQAIPNVQIDALRNNLETTLITNDEGEFSLRVADGETITIDVSYNNGYLNGVDIGDVIRIQSHILYIDRINDDFQRIAADVNNDDVINVKDILGIRSIILERTDSFFNNQSWRFFEPLTMEETISISDIDRGYSLSLKGIKIGDVDNQGVQVGRSTDDPELKINDDLLKAGHQSRISIDLPDQIIGYQFAIKFNPALISIVDITGEGFSVGNWNQISDSECLVLYSAAHEAKDIMVDVLSFADVQLSEALSIGSIQDCSSLAVTTEFKKVPLNASFIEVEEKKTFELFQNRPNPATAETYIGFSLPEDGLVELSIFDLSGRIILKEEWSAYAGNHEKRIDAQALEGEGVYYYQLKTSDNCAVRKMAVLSPSD